MCVGCTRMQGASIQATPRLTSTYVQAVPDYVETSVQAAPTLVVRATQYAAVVKRCQDQTPQEIIDVSSQVNVSSVNNAQHIPFNITKICTSPDGGACTLNTDIRSLAKRATNYAAG
ncbi:hypothetical protein SNE40_008057 [Patella caerulea]|uniref:Uncharacterized protein n=1 Tax=Patella caerulea TaxID=87958 RepID=A0AAN8Q9P4_PATCE